MSISISRWLLAAALGGLAGPTLADGPTATPAEPDALMLDAVVVTGEFPAPGLWELSRDGKTLLVMGTLSPAPKRMVWTSNRVESRIAESDLILGPPGVSVGADVGFFGGAMLWPAYRRSKRNPDGQLLEDVLSAPVYDRWRLLKQQYLGRSGSVEKLRPLHAAKELFDAAVRDAGMTDESLVEPVVRKLAKAHDIPVRSTTLRLTIEDPKATLAQLNATELSDEQCLVQTMDRLDADLSMMVARANAWAAGEIATLRAMPFVDQKQACRRALASNEIARQQGITDLDAHVRQRWLEVAREALSEHDVVFATLPLARLFEQGGILETLEDEGFSVKAPE